MRAWPAPSRWRAQRTRSAVSAVIVLSAQLGGCVYLPYTTNSYDPKCQTYEKQMRLEVQQIGMLLGCHNESCVAALVAFGAVSAATAVVSGSIVVVGNVVYWLEKQGRCNEAPATPKT